MFERSPEQTLVLLLDFKTNSDSLLPRVIDQIEPFRDQRYLSFWNGTHVVPGAVTIVLTGKTPDRLAIQQPDLWHVFLDAPLEQLWEALPAADPIEVEVQAESLSTPLMAPSQSRWDVRGAYFASTSFRKSIGRPWLGHLSTRQMELMRGQIRGAHMRGLQVRYWDLPNWPTTLRSRIWKLLLDEGADILNVDDLYAVASNDWTKVEHR